MKHINIELLIFCKDIGLNNPAPDQLNRILSVITERYKLFSINNIKDAFMRFITRDLGLKNYEIYGKSLNTLMITKILSQYRDNYFIVKTVKKNVELPLSVTPEIAKKNFDELILELFNQYIETRKIDFWNIPFLYDTLKKRGLIKMTPEIWLSYASRISSGSIKEQNQAEREHKSLGSIINRIINKEKESEISNIHSDKIKYLVMHDTFAIWQKNLIDLEELLKKN